MLFSLNFLLESHGVINVDSACQLIRNEEIRRKPKHMRHREQEIEIEMQREIEGERERERETEICRTLNGGLGKASERQIKCTD